MTCIKGGSLGLDHVITVTFGVGFFSAVGKLVSEVLHVATDFIGLGFSDIVGKLVARVEDGYTDIFRVGFFYAIGDFFAIEEGTNVTVEVGLFSVVVRFVAGVEYGITDTVLFTEEGPTDLIWIVFFVIYSDTVGFFVIKVVEGTEDTAEFSNSSILRRCLLRLITFIPTAISKESVFSSTPPLRNMGRISPLPLCLASVSILISGDARLPPMR